MITAWASSIVYTIINTTLVSLLGIDRGGSYFGTLVQMMRVKRGVKPTDREGLVILPDRWPRVPDPGRARPSGLGEHHGGLGIRDGTHRLSHWEALLPSMTSASQLGILHGNNDGIPAFRWFERIARS